MAGSISSFQEVNPVSRKGTKRVIWWMVVAIAAAGLMSTIAVETFAHVGGKPDPRLLLRQSMRKLWAEHAFWTREHMIAALAGSLDAQEVRGRLLKNQEEIGYALAFHYGMEAGNKLTDLLKAHIRIEGEVLEAAKSGDQAKLQEADKRWHSNADEIVAFLSKANSNWPPAGLKDVLYRHLSLTKEMAMARIQKNWKEDIAAFDKDLEAMMVMADGLAEGIIKQFPAKFHN